MEQFRLLLKRLAAKGWSPLLDLLEIDPESPNLREDLLRPLPLSPNELALVPGFGDLAPSARRAIEPGSPARSVLFHALASPGVVTDPNGKDLAAFPTPAELDLAENTVFGIVPPSLTALIARLGGVANLAVTVFAREYRQAAKTVHGKHADMIFSRTGVARIGTTEALWDGRRRAYVPRKDTDGLFEFRVLPCRYGVYLSVQARGDQDDFGPYKFNRAFEISTQFGLDLQPLDRKDEEMDFWVPVHKLFDGESCLLGHDLAVALEQDHVNEKLRRVHEENMGVPAHRRFDSGFKAPKTDVAPFLITEGLAEFLTPNPHGIGTLAAVVRPSMIEATTINGDQIGTRVPPNLQNTLAPSFNIEASGNAHPAPEWMHVRSRLLADGTVDDLNKCENVAEIVQKAQVDNTPNYLAAHYTDFTCDGWIDARVDGLGSELSRMIPAYSLLAAPDFYPHVDQSELLDWWLYRVPTALRNNIWSIPPLTLADQRSAANINLRKYGADIRPENRTPTALVGLEGSARTQRSLGSEAQVARVSSLPDAAAGIYQPGWDVSTDVTFDPGLGEQVLHLAAYGLGSPFPEDAKLCAALSAYWPGVAPDAARSAGRRAIAPMTDREVGLVKGVPAWDGVPGPRRVTIQGQDYVETDNFDHVDYVTNTLADKFTMVETMKVSQQDYQTRVLATARMYRLIGDIWNLEQDLSGVHRRFRLLSFGQGRASDATIEEAEQATGLTFDDRACRYDMALVGSTEPIKLDPNDLTETRWLRHEEIELVLQIVVGERPELAYRISHGSWAIHQLKVS